MPTAFQIEVARLFFRLPASAGFLLAGGAALLAQQLTTRPTQDLDFFTGPGRGDVATARDQFERAAGARGWRVERIRDTDTFCRLLIHGPEQLLREPDGDCFETTQHAYLLARKPAVASDSASR